MTYRNNFISTTIFRIDFSPILLLQGSLKPDYQESMRAQFPNLEAVELTEVRLMISGTSSEKKGEATSIKQWSLSNKEKTYKITSCFNWFAVECFKYASFQEFDEIVRTAFTNFKRFYEPVVCKRLGLRYINNINFKEGDPLIWSEYLLPFLAKTIEDFPDRGNLSRAMSQFTIAKDDFKILINTGMPNREYPGKISRKEFTIDLDCSTEDCENKDPLSSLKIFHDEIETFFENCITEKLRGVMRGDHEG